MFGMFCLSAPLVKSRQCSLSHIITKTINAVRLTGTLREYKQNMGFFILGVGQRVAKRKNFEPNFPDGDWRHEKIKLFT